MIDPVTVLMTVTVIDDVCMYETKGGEYSSARSGKSVIRTVAGR